MFGTYLATWIKLRRPGLLFGTYGGIALVTALITAVVFLNASAGTTAAAADNGPGQGVTLASLALSSGLLRGLTSSATIIGLIALCVAAAQVAGGYTQGTLRTLLIREPRRLRLLGGEWAAVSVFSAGAVAIAAVAVAITALILANSRGIDTGAWLTYSGLSTSLRAVGEVMLATVGFATFGAALGSLLRTPVLAIALGVAWLLPLERILAGTVSGSDRWLPGQLLAAVASSGTSTVSLAAAIATVTGYLLVAAVAAGTLFRRRDVTA